MLKIYFDIDGNITKTINASAAETEEGENFIVVSRQGLPFSFTELVENYWIVDGTLTLK